jgi:taurine dioxygenase
MRLEVEQLTPSIGSEVIGLDPGARLDRDTVAVLRDVFDDRGVLVFREVDLDRTQQYRLATILRNVQWTEDDIALGAASQDNYWISNRVENAGAPFGRLLFHSDGMWSDQPFEVLSLYGVEVESPTSPTLFASSTHAWELLPDALRRRVEDLRAVHVAGPDQFHPSRRERCRDASWVVREGAPIVVAPIKKIHPRTGKPVLFVAENHTDEIVGLSTGESDDLVDEMYAYLYGPENVYEHVWRERDLVLWDNIGVQHARPGLELDGPARSLRKVGVPRPVGTDMMKRPGYQQIV